jgi:hypothetical protein
MAGVFSWLTKPLELEHDPATMTVRIGGGHTQIEITEKLKADMGKKKFEELVELMRHDPGIFDVQKVLDEMMKSSSVHTHPVSGPATSQMPQRNYEAAIHSRLAVLGELRHPFDLIKVHRTRDGSKFYVFTVVNDNWVVLEDDELFPSDKLISSLRLLTL